MTKKSILIMAVTVVLAVALAIGGTVAYFTAESTATNKFTFGDVDFDFEEEVDSSDGSSNSEGGYDYDKVVPGDVLTKKPVVTMKNNSEPAYVRVIVKDFDTEVFEALTINEGWTAVTVGDDIIITLDTVAEAGFKGAPFDTVTIKSDVENGQEMTEMVIVAQAAQAAGFETADAAFSAAFAD